MLRRVLLVNALFALAGAAAAAAAEHEKKAAGAAAAAAADAAADYDRDFAFFLEDQNIAFADDNEREHSHGFVPVPAYPELEDITYNASMIAPIQAEAHSVYSDESFIEADNTNLERRQTSPSKAQNAITFPSYIDAYCFISSSTLSLTTILSTAGIVAVDSNTNYNAESCYKKCIAKGFTTANPDFFYFGLTNGNSLGGKCWCSIRSTFDSFRNQVFFAGYGRPDCIACAGNELCGDAMTTIKFYKTHSFGSSLQTIGSNAQKFQYMNCYDDSHATIRTLAFRNTAWPKTLTAAGCAVSCNVNGYTHFGMEFYAQCWCGTLSSTAKTSTACTTKCEGDPTSPTLCGGKNAISVYKYVSTLTTNSSVKLLSLGQGAVIKNVQVNILKWGNAIVPTNLAQFYTDIVSAQSKWWAVLQQYSGIGTGTYIGTTTLTTITNVTFPTTGTVDHSVIIDYLKAYLPSKTKTVNSFYSIHLPAGVTVTNNGKTSCVDFCCFHDYVDVFVSTISTSKVKVTYAVFPDITGSGCKCKIHTDNENNFAAYSHELAEVVTDPYYDGTGTGTGWIDRRILTSISEITDICNNQRGWITVGSNNYPVTGLWSNLAGACVFS